MKEGRIMNKKIPCIFLFVILLLSLCSFRALASGQINTGADVSMSLRYTGKKGPVTGASFHVYHIADVTEHGDYIIKDKFKTYPIAFHNLTQDDWQKLATTLKGYVWKDQIPEFDSGKTDKDGALTFPSAGVSMKPGLYLVLGDTRVIGSYTYYATPFLICLPGNDIAGGQTVYHLEVAPKYRWDYDPPGRPEPSRISRKVLKVWNDEGNESARPDSITVSLLRDGTVFDTVKLHKGNNWRYTWSSLSKGYNWSVVEEEVPGYTVNVSQEGITFVLTNTSTSDQPENKEEHTQEEEENELFVLGEVEDATGNFHLAVLPQTGQLWWPVPIFICLGFVCMIIGAISRRSSYEED